MRRKTKNVISLFYFPKNARRQAGQGEVEQLVARLAHNQEVAGSSPAFATKIHKLNQVKRSSLCIGGDTSPL